MKKAIFFDNDGILVDTEPLYFEANRKVMALENYKLTEAKHIEHNMTKGLSVFDFLIAEGVTDARVSELLEQRNRIYQDLIKTKLHIFPMAEKILQKLKKSFGLGIVTSSRRNMFKAIHAQTKFLEYVDFVIDREDVVRSKPHPEPYLKALELSGVKPEEALVIEDSARGLQSAVSAGIDCWVIPTEMTAHQDFSKAQKQLKSIAELQELLIE